MFMQVAVERLCTDDGGPKLMIERPDIDADGRLAPLVPAVPTRDIRADGGKSPATSPDRVVDEVDAPLVPDLS
jgi:hypothetical protein